MYTANEITRQNRLEEMRVAKVLSDNKKAQDRAIVSQWREEVIPLLLWEQEAMDQEEAWEYSHSYHGERLVGRRFC